MRSIVFTNAVLLVVGFVAVIANVHVDGHQHTSRRRRSKHRKGGRIHHHHHHQRRRWQKDENPYADVDGQGACNGTNHSILSELYYTVCSETCETASTCPQVDGIKNGTDPKCHQQFPNDPTSTYCFIPCETREDCGNATMSVECVKQGWPYGICTYGTVR